MNYLKISWRNIWRNKRRTLITAASVMFAVSFAILMRSFQDGTYDRAIENMVRMFSGYMQIHAQGFQDDQIIDNVMPYDSTLIVKINQHKNVENVFPRLQYFGFISTGTITREALIIGANHMTENYITHVAHKIIAGTMITDNDSDILIGEALALFLGVSKLDTLITKKKINGIEKIDTTIYARIINDTVIILGQGYHGSMAVAKLHVKGIIKFPIYDLNKRVIYMSLSTAQNLFNAPKMLTSLNIILKNNNNLPQTHSQILERINSQKLELLTWQEMQPELVQQIESDKGSGVIFILLLYLIIGFGIFGTVIMMTNERKREFGIMVAIGMRKEKLAAHVAIELFYIGLLGTIAGIILACPVITYFWFNPIEFTGEMAKAYEQYGWEAVMPIAIKPEVFIIQAVIIFCLFIATSIYPITKILKINIIKAIHN